MGHTISRETSTIDLTKTKLLWLDHVYWTREVILASVNRTGNLDEAVKRLLKNQEDLGNDLAQYYGPDAGAKYTALLKEHIVIAKKIIDDVVAGRNYFVNYTAWVNNGNEIAAFLKGLNPSFNLYDNSLEEMFKQHLDLTAAELLTAANNDWANSVKYFDQGRDHVIAMVDKIATILQLTPKGCNDGCVKGRHNSCYNMYLSQRK